MMILQNKVVFLTGGSIGNVLECAKAYARVGCKVAPCDRSREGDVKASEDLNDIPAVEYCPKGDVIAGVSVILLTFMARGHIMHVSGGAELGYQWFLLQSKEAQGI